MCLHTFCANTCRQAFCESTCRQTFLNPKVKPPKSALSLNRLPAGILNTSVCISVIPQCVWNVCREVFWAYTCASMLYLNVSKSSAGRYSEYIRVHLCYIAMSLNRLPAGILNTWTHSRGAPMTKIRPARPWALAPRSGRFFHTKGMLGRAARDEIGFGGLLVLNPCLGFWNSWFICGVVFSAGFFYFLIVQNTCRQTFWVNPTS